MPATYDIEVATTTAQFAIGTESYETDEGYRESYEYEYLDYDAAVAPVVLSAVRGTADTYQDALKVSAHLIASAPTGTVARVTVHEQGGTSFYASGWARPETLVRDLRFVSL